MSLTPFERRRAAAVLAAAAIVVVVCFATGNGVVGAVLLALTPALVYRVTGHAWGEAFARVSGRAPAPSRPAAERVVPAGSRDRRMPGSGERVAAIAMLVVAVPVALGLLSALVGSVIGSDDATLGVGIAMTLSWTGFAAMLSGLVVGADGPRKLIALAAGAATALSVALWVSVVG